MYGQFKKTDVAMQLLPYRAYSAAAIADLRDGPRRVDRIMRIGADKAREKAAKP